MSVLSKIYVLKGDITTLDADAVVNAANSGLMGGGGVDGAIHRAGGIIINEECSEIIKKIGRLEPGKAVITSGGNLKAPYVIHTVGPIWHGGTKGEEEILAECYRSCLKLASEKGIKTIAFPNISTGIFGYPKERAAKTAFDTVIKELVRYKTIDRVGFVCFDDYNYKLYIELITKYENK